MKLQHSLTMVAIAGAMVLAPGTALAQTVDFEDLGVTLGTQLNPPGGWGVVSQGYNYTPGPNDASGFNDLHIAWDDGAGASNGTVVGGTHDDVVLGKVGGGVFDLTSFDYGGFPVGNEITFSVTGTYFGGGTITSFFTPDGVVDGIGGAVDFETFTMGAGWTGLVSVTWDHSGAGTVAGIFYLDNINTGPVPEPASLAVLGLGALALIRRKR